jgi:RNA polymerase sigma-70 factor (ECF subfamily)
MAGEPGAFAELVQRYRAPVYSYLARCGVPADDRDDLFQEIFIRIHRGAGTYSPERPLHPWIFTVVANVVRTFLRRRRVRELVYGELVEVPEPRTVEPDGERLAVARQTMDWLEQRIQRLPLKRREVLLLACIQSRPLKEVAEILGMPVNTVKTHLRRARLTLASELAALNAEVRS